MQIYLAIQTTIIIATGTVIFGLAVNYLIDIFSPLYDRNASESLEPNF
jgi:hypothetical protein